MHESLQNRLKIATSAPPTASETSQRFSGTNRCEQASKRALGRSRQLSRDRWTKADISVRIANSDCKAHHCCALSPLISPSRPLIDLHPWQGRFGRFWLFSGLVSTALTFEHVRIANHSVNRPLSRIEYTTVEFEMLPMKLTLRALQRSHESILCKALNKKLSS